MTGVLFESERLVIRAFHPEEEQLFLDLYADETVTEFIQKRSREENKKRFADGIAQLQDGTGLGRRAVFNRADGEFIGVCGLRPTDFGPHCAELGYVLHQKYWGKGIAREMARAMVTYAFENTGVTELIAVTMSLNIASQRVLGKAGFTRGENIFRDGQELAFFKISKAV